MDKSPEVLATEIAINEMIANYNNEIMSRDDLSEEIEEMAHT